MTVIYKLKQEMIDEGRAVSKWAGLKAKCISKNLPFNLTVEQVKDFNAIKYCQITGEKLSYVEGSNQLSNSLTYDKIIPKKGYVYDNIAIISNRVNVAKGNMSFLEIVKLSQFVKKQLNMTSKTDSVVVKHLKALK